MKTPRDEENFEMTGSLRDHQLRTLQRGSSKKKAILMGKLLLLFVCLLVYSIWNSKRTKHRVPPQCIEDILVTQSVAMDHLNERMADNSGNWSRLLLLSSSALVDLGAFTSMYGTATRQKTLRWMWTIMAFFGLRAFIQNQFFMKFPKGTVMNYPGFPSFTVPYGIWNDFYYSGHCGFLMISALANYDFGFKKIAIVNMLSIPYLVFVLAVHRVHYTIDLIIGVLVGIYMFISVGMRSEFIDEFCGKLVRKYILKIRWFSEV